MNGRKSKLPASIVLLLFTCVSIFPQVHGGGGKADIKEGLGSTWKGKSGTLISRLIKKKPVSDPRAATAKRRVPPVRPVATTDTTAASLTFRPNQTSGVDEALATAFASTPAEKQTLIQLFTQLKQGYETEVAKEGKSNNLAAAMTFFIASNVVAYHRTPMPSDEATEELFISLRDIMSTTPEIAKLTNAEKQQMHDWLVYMGGFVLATYLEATNTNDREALDNSKLIAGYSTQIVLGIDIGKINFSDSGFSFSGGGTAFAFLDEEEMNGNWSFNLRGPSAIPDRPFVRGEYH